MVVVMREIILQGENMVKEHMCGQMEVNTLVNGLKIKFMGKVAINGQMEELMKVIGLRTIWMVKEFILGKMEEDMKVHI